MHRRSDLLLQEAVVRIRTSDVLRESKLAVRKVRYPNSSEPLAGHGVGVDFEFSFPRLLRNGSASDRIAPPALVISTPKYELVLNFCPLIRCFGTGSNGGADMRQSEKVRAVYVELRSAVGPRASAADVLAIAASLVELFSARREHAFIRPARGAPAVRHVAG